MKKFNLVAMIITLGISCMVSAETIYLAKVNFGENSFNDILILSETARGPAREMQGTFTVPGQFTSQVTGVLSHTGFSYTHLTLQGVGEERGEKFPFRIQASSNFDHTVFHGNIIVGDQEPVVGTIQLELLKEIME